MIEFNRSKRAGLKVSDQEISIIARALSHPARIEILRILSKQGECICSQIEKELPYYAQSTVSQHLGYLRKADLIMGTIDGNKSYYQINWIRFAKFHKDYLAMYSNFKADFSKVV
jgi:DNA-binding transcriptional ArsR family regulator